MNEISLDGLAVHKPSIAIQKSTSDDLVENNCIQNRGREIKLKNNNTILSEQGQSETKSKSMHERVIAIPFQLRERLSSSTAEDLQHFAKKIVARFGAEAVKKSLTPELKYAVALEYIGKAYKRVVHIEELKDFSPYEKYQLLSTIQKRSKTIVPEKTAKWLAVDSHYRFELYKESFQLPELSPDDCTYLSDFSILQTSKEMAFADYLEFMRTLVNENCPELASVLITEIDIIDEKYSCKVVNSDGKIINTGRLRKCQRHANKLIKIVAACSAISEKADITELKSYITSILKDFDNVNGNIWHITKELAFLSKHPGSLGYSRYIDAVARILGDTSFTVDNYGHLKQLTDIKGFSLLSGKKTLTDYLKGLEQLVEHLPPAHAQILRTEIEAIKKEFDHQQPGDAFPATDRQAIKKRVHRLLLVIAACSKSPDTTAASALAPFVKGIIEHGNKNNNLYLVSGLASLFQSPPEIQKLLCPADIKGGNHLLLAPLGLVRLYNAGLISEQELETISNNLKENTVASKRAMKDGKVFHQWLVTLDRIRAASSDRDIGQVLQDLTKNNKDIYKKLGWLDIKAMAAKEGIDALQLLTPRTCQKEGSLSVKAEQGTAGLSEKIQSRINWLMKQRHPHHLLTYLHYHQTPEKNNLSVDESTELTNLIDDFLEACVTDKFIKARQAPEKNPHLQAVYQKRPDFQGGWKVNLKEFSENLDPKLRTGDTLMLTEDPWDLFISGLEVDSCQSPDLPGFTCALMSYVMDGRNAMIVKKNAKGNILSRAVIRIVLDNNKSPALFIEPIYPEVRRDNDTSLFIDAAREIAHQKKLSLYKGKVSDKRQTKLLTMLEGRAPFDYFDSTTSDFSNGHLIKRGKVLFPGKKMKPYVPSKPETIEFKE